MRNRRRKSNSKRGLDGTRILLIVTGGIAAYKSVFLVRLLKRSGAEVRVVMSEAATRFIAPLTFEVLSENPVSSDLFASRESPVVGHVELATWADRAIVAPATADFIAKAALGLADDLASTVFLAARCPRHFAPSMNTGMWKNPAVRRNIDTLQGDGCLFVDPGAGGLACGESGTGRMAEPETIVKAIETSLGPGELEGVRFLVTAGRTEESIDPVRYISNRSSGRMGFAIATEARRRGARVTLIHGPVDVPPPNADSIRRVTTAAEMKTAVRRAFPGCDVLVMAAAVADFTPVKRAGSKVKRNSGAVSIELKATGDILASLAEKKNKTQVVIGFALETENAEANVLKKIKAKRCDYMVLNMTGEGTGFSVPTNQVTIYRGPRKILSTSIVTKEEAASAILDRIASDGRIKQARQ